MPAKWRFTRSDVMCSTSHGYTSGERAMSPMFAMSPLSPLRACARCDSVTESISRLPSARGQSVAGSGAGVPMSSSGVGQSSSRSPAAVTSVGRTRSRGSSAGQYATTSCACGRPPVTATPGGPDRITAGSIFENASILPRSWSRTPKRSSTSGTSTSGASGPQQAEAPTNSVSEASNSSPSRSQNSSENARALAVASGPLRMRVPLAFQPSA